MAALLFAWSGCLSHLFFIPGHRFSGVFVGAPFGAVAGWLCTRRARTTLMIAVLDCIVWYVAYSTAVLFSNGLGEATSMLTGGCIGGLGVIAANAIAGKRWLSVVALAGGALVGAVAAVPFAMLAARNGQSPLIPFVVWQAAVGTCLYAYNEFS